MADESIPGAAPVASAPNAAAPAAPTAPAQAAAEAPAAPAKRNPYAGPPRARVSPEPAATALDAAPPALADAKPARPTDRASKQLAAVQAELTKTRGELKDLRRYETLATRYAETELAALPEDKRALLVKHAGKRPEDQLAKLAEWREIGYLGTGSQGLPAPANTSPSAAAKPSAADATDPDVALAREHDRLKKAGQHMRANALFATQRAAIARGLAKLSPS